MDEDLKTQTLGGSFPNQNTPYAPRWLGILAERRKVLTLKDGKIMTREEADKLSPVPFELPWRAPTR